MASAPSQCRRYVSTPDRGWCPTVCHAPVTWSTQADAVMQGTLDAGRACIRRPALVLPRPVQDRGGCLGEAPSGSCSTRPGISASAFEHSSRRAAAPAWPAGRPSATAETSRCRGSASSAIAARQAGTIPAGTISVRLPRWRRSLRHALDPRADQHWRIRAWRFPARPPATPCRRPDDRAGWPSRGRTASGHDDVFDAPVTISIWLKAIGRGVGGRQSASAAVDLDPGGATPRTRASGRAGRRRRRCRLPAHDRPARAGMEAASRTGSMPLRKPLAGWR